MVPASFGSIIGDQESDVKLLICLLDKTTGIKYTPL
jgi:hypothetical protein